MPPGLSEAFLPAVGGFLQSSAGGLDSETAIIIIKQQARRIDELQRENEDLRAKLDELTA